MKDCGIYIIINKVNGKRYIGQAQSFKKRFKAHRNGLKRKDHPNIHLQNAWDKYGKESFEFIPLLYCEISELGYYESFYVNKFKTIDPRFGYNLMIPNGNSGFVHSPKSIEKMRAAKIGKKYTPERIAGITGKNNHMFGKKHSPQSIEKMRQAHIGKTLSPEHIEKLRIAGTGENNNFHGKNHTPETKEKLRIANSGENSSWFGKHHSPLTRKKIGDAQRGCKNHMWGKKISREDRVKRAIAGGSKLFAVFLGDRKIGEWINQVECASDLMIHNACISRCLKGQQKTTQGYTFAYVN